MNQIPTFKKRSASLISSALFALFMAIWITSCGLPSLANIDLEPTRPDVSGYSNGTDIFINISGTYPSRQFPEFNGFNIYFGSNNVDGNILKRVIYQSERNELPSISVRISSDIPSVTLSNNFSYRLTSASDEQDLSDERLASTNDEATNPIRTHNDYYFIIRPLNNYKEAPSSETLNIYIPNIIDNQPVSFPVGESATLSSPLTGNNENPPNTSVFTLTLSHDNNYFTISPANTNIRGTNSYVADQITGCYQSTVTTDTQTNERFQTSEMLLRENYAYRFIYVDDPSYSYLFYYRVYVSDISGNTLTLCTAYERRDRS